MLSLERTVPCLLEFKSSSPFPTLQSVSEVGRSPPPVGSARARKSCSAQKVPGDLASPRAASQPARPLPLINQ